MIKKLYLKNFRIFREKTVTFSPGVNVILGKNGVGKTSILEAIYFLTFTKSFKAPRDVDMIKEGENHFQIRANWENSLYQDIQGNFLKGKGKRFIFDEEIMKRLADIIGAFPIVFQSPEDYRVTSGSSSERRTYFDRFISQISKNYLSDLIHYRRLLKIRNAYLKELNEKRLLRYDAQIEIYDEQLAPIIYRITTKRKIYTDKFNQHLKELYKSMMNNESIGKIEYIPSIEGNDENSFKANYMKKNNENIEKEIILKRSIQGSNYDKFNFYRNGRPLIHFASQGEHKIWMTMLKLAEGEIIKSASGKDAIFLLDDLFAELDINNSQKIINKILNKNQVLITTTDLSDLRHHGMSEEKSINIIEITQ